jgi:hypothetical protein
MHLQGTLHANSRVRTHRMTYCLGGHFGSCRNLRLPRSQTVLMSREPL